MDDPQVRPLLPRPLRPRELIALDALAAAGYVAVFLSTAAAAETTLPGWVRALIVAGIGAPLAVRRRWPLPVFAVVLALSVVGHALGVVSEPFLAAAFALYPVALRRPRPRWEPTLAIGIASAVGILSLSMVGSTVGTAAEIGMVVLGAGIMGGVWTVGRAVRERRAYMARAAEQLAEQAAAEERLRIARELHDVVSHTLSLIGVKAAVANHVAASRPQEVREALRVIEDTSRTALFEMHQLLGLLRSGPDPTGPVPGIGGLPELAERAALAGVAVELDVHGVERLPPGLAASVYRIVQEAVTNVVKHAAPAHCRVAVTGTADEVRIDVTDDGPGHRRLPGPDEPGHGLIGMRERVHLHGGSFTAGPRPDGGFAVSARLGHGRPS